MYRYRSLENAHNVCFSSIFPYVDTQINPILHKHVKTTPIHLEISIFIRWPSTAAGAGEAAATEGHAAGTLGLALTGAAEGLAAEGTVAEEQAAEEPAAAEGPTAEGVGPWRTRGRKE